MLAGIGGFSVSTAACIKNCANNALGITVYRQTQRQHTAALLANGCDDVTSGLSDWLKYIGD